MHLPTIRHRQDSTPNVLDNRNQTDQTDHQDQTGRRTKLPRRTGTGPSRCTKFRTRGPCGPEESVRPLVGPEADHWPVLAVTVCLGGRVASVGSLSGEDGDRSECDGRKQLCRAPGRYQRLPISVPPSPASRHPSAARPRAAADRLICHHFA